MENQNQFQPQPNYNLPQIPLPNGSAVLVLGIISLVGCFCYGITGVICAIIALVLASKDLKLYNANPTSYTQGSLKNLKSGRICAIIGLSISMVFVIIIIISIVVFGLAALSDPTHFVNTFNH